MNLRNLSMEGKKLFQQLETLLKGPALDACRLNFETRILMGKKLPDFLDDVNNKHPLFHEHYPATPCCKCIGSWSLAATGKKASLTKPQFMLLFDNTRSPKPSHELKTGNVVTQFCLCTITPQKTVTISALDISIIHVFAYHCSSSNKLDRGWLHDIRKVRNDLAHASTNSVDKTTFESIWKILETAALGFASEVGEIAEKYIRKEIGDIKKVDSTDDVEKVKEVVVELTRSVDRQTEATEEANAKLQTGLNGLNAKFMLIGQINERLERLEEQMEIRDSKNSLQITEETKCVNQDISMEMKVNGSIPNESEAIDRLQNRSCDNDGEQFKLEYAGRGCLLLKMTSNREIFKDEESLHFAISSLMERVIIAGEINTSVVGTIKMVITLTSPITKEERNVLCRMLSKFGCLNETRNDLPYQEEKESSLMGSPDSSLTAKFAFTEKQFETLTEEEVLCINIENIVCKLDLKGLSFNKDPTSETEKEDTALYLVEWIWACPNTWDISEIANTMNDSRYLQSHIFQSILWSSDENEHQLVIRTKTQRQDLSHPSSVELVVHSFVSSIVDECNLHTSSNSSQVLSITAAIMCSEEVREEDGSDSIETNRNTNCTSLNDNIVVCIHCHESFECLKCMEKGEKITQLSKELIIKSRRHQKVETSVEKHEDKISKEESEQEADSVHSSSNDYLEESTNNVNTYQYKCIWISYLRYYKYFITAITPVLVLLLGILIYYLHDLHLQRKDISRVIKPLNIPKINAQNSTMPHVKPELFWGTYRANLYFGMKTRSPRSPVVGLMWFGEFPGAKKRPKPNIRHWCMPDDNVEKYGWKKHDGKNFGIQEIVDTNFTLTTSFIKRHNKDGGDWSWRISVMPKNENKSGIVSLLVYVALENEGKLDPIIENGRIKYIDGSSTEFGDFVFTFPSAKKSNTVKYSGLVTQHTGFTHFEDVLMPAMTGISWNNTHFFTSFRPLKTVSKTNMIVHQVTGVLPLEIDVVYETGEFKNKPNPYSMKNNFLTQALEVASQEFDDRFASTFNLKDKGFSLKEIDFAKNGISNLLGEISYFYGSSRVKSEFNKKYNKDPLKYWEAGLYTSIPSRTYFPRGFYWNFGFDSLIISLWDPKITEDIIAHWLDLLNNEGWIPREQILGEEARARCPEKFIVQDNKNANPPTIFITLKYLMRRGLIDKQFLKKIFPRLRVLFNWLNTSQAGNNPSTYYWRGRHYETREQINPLTPSSGFDDYPRASYPNFEERHLDLRCWMALASGTMADIGKKLKKEWKVYEDMHHLLVDNEILDKYHWSPLRGMYSDVGLHLLTEDLGNQPKLRFINAFGYSSLFPLMLRIIDPDSVRLTKMLTDIKRRELLWTNFGLRSLARNSTFYQLPNTDIDPPYWRGSIWINMNYMTLSGLYYYGKTPGINEQVALSTYNDLRNNIISNVIREYSRKGSLYEQYDDQTGEGKGAHPFSGWSALIVAIMAEEY